jgi:methionine-S-sulfoxide reductase
VIQVTYDPERVTYSDLLDVFFDAHDPTQLNRQGEDVGRQYRSAIFFANDEQQKQAKAKIADLEAKHVYQHKIVTKLEKLKVFYPAEDDHQDFARRNPYVPYIQGHSIPNAMRVRSKHPDLIRKEN